MESKTPDRPASCASVGRETVTLGNWLPQQDEYDDLISGPLAWDIFFVFDSDAVWDDAPSPVLASGSTIISKKSDLERNLLPLLRN
jgi:hypothetical protein